MSDSPNSFPGLTLITFYPAEADVAIMAGWGPALLATAPTSGDEEPAE